MLYALIMELNASYNTEYSSSMQRLQHEPWPLEPVDPNKANFPCCIVWTPLPVVSWLAPFIGHVGICREDGVVLDFSGSNFVNVDDFAFGAAARYLQLDRNQVMFLKLPLIDILRKITYRTNSGNNNSNVLVGNGCIWIYVYRRK